MTTDYYFVYGTLKRTYGNNRVLGASEFVGTAVSLRPSFKMTNVGFPYLFQGGESFVSGEVFRVTSDSVKQGLDRLEGYPRHYTREILPFVLGGSLEVVDAWVYLNPRDYDYYESYVRRVQPNTNNILTWSGRQTEHTNDAA